MPESGANLAVFIDYDNLSRKQKAAGVLDVVTRALLSSPITVEANPAKCDVRVYGGWYEGLQITRLAQDVTLEIQRDFPRLIRLRSDSKEQRALLVNAELAVSLLQEPGHHLFNTYRRKGKPANVRVEDQVAVGCADPACMLPAMRKLLRTGYCPKAGCTVAIGDLVYRHEQKIIDTMLTCDLLYAAAKSGAGPLIIISADDDFLPPIRTALLSGAAVVRIHPQPNCQRASFPIGGVSLVEIEL